MAAHVPDRPLDANPIAKAALVGIQVRAAPLVSRLRRAAAAAHASANARAGSALSLRERIGIEA